MPIPYCVLSCERAEPNLVHLQNHVIHLGSELLEATQADALAARLRLWPRFAAYVVVAMMTQVPISLTMLITRLGGHAPSGQWFQVALALSLSHGAVNCVVHELCTGTCLRGCGAGACSPCFERRSHSWSCWRRYTERSTELRSTFDEPTAPYAHA